MNEWITIVNDVIWSYVLIAALVGCGLWFTWRTRFVQFRMVGEMLRLLTESAVSTVEEQVKMEGGRRRRHTPCRPRDDVSDCEELICVHTISLPFQKREIHLLLHLI